MTAGCTSGNFNSIHRTFNLDTNQSQLVDVKQRSILVSRSVTTTYDKMGNGKVEMSAPRVCAEPSPDALSAYASAISAQGSDRLGDSAAFSGSSSEQATAFGLRTQSIQLMRDAYYRACEAYLSNAIDDETYDVLIRRLNNQAIAYLAVEAITSNASKASQSVVKAPDLTQVTADVVAANEAFQQAIKTRDKDSSLLNDPAVKASEEKLKAAKEKLKADEEDVSTKQTAANEAAKKLVDASKSQASSASGNAGGGDATTAAVNAASQIALSIVTGDYSPEMCFAHLRRLKAGDGEDVISRYCQDVLKIQESGLTARVEAAAADTQIRLKLADMVVANCNPVKANDKSRELCAKILGALDTSAGTVANMMAQAPGMGAVMTRVPPNATIAPSPP